MAAEAPLGEALESLDLTAAPTTHAKLQRYIETLEHWNQMMNLTALEGYERVLRLVAEPLWVAEQLRPGGGYLDIGSGNGSPAFPWLLTGAFERADLVESRRRRAVFLRQAARALQVPGVNVHPLRFDEFVPARPADWVTIQGVRLTAELRGQIVSTLPGARIVWFTRRTDTPFRPDQSLEIPNSDRCAMVFTA